MCGLRILIKQGVKVNEHRVKQCHKFQWKAFVHKVTLRIKCEGFYRQSKSADNFYLLRGECVCA